MSVYPVTAVQSVQAFAGSVSDGAKKMALRIHTLATTYLDITKILLITTVALSCIAFVGSLILNSHLLVSLSVTLGSISAYAYKLYADLAVSKKENTRLKDHILDAERIRRENVAMQQEMRGSIDKLELVKLDLEATNKDLQGKLTRTVELVEFCEKVVSQAAGRTEVASSDVARQLESHKEVIKVWLKEIKKGLREKERALEVASSKVISILSEFSVGQHTELTRMLEQLRALQQQIDTSKVLIADQQETLRGISLDIRSGAEELSSLHRKLAAMHEKLLLEQTHTHKVLTPVVEEE